MVSTKMYAVNEKLCVACIALEDAKRKITENENFQLVSTIPSSNQASVHTFCLSNLGQHYWFARFVEDAMAQCPESKLMICTGPDNARFTSSCFLVGCYSIIHENATIEHIFAAFQHAACQFQEFQEPAESNQAGEKLTVFDGWRALHTAMANGWLNF